MMYRVRFNVSEHALKSQINLQPHPTLDTTHKYIVSYLLFVNENKLRSKEDERRGAVHITFRHVECQILSFP